MVKVSVIVPVYNAESSLEKCLDSILGQTLEDIEIIAVDDGSVDGSGVILKAYMQRTDKLKCFFQPNAGAGAARNLGLRHATGTYIGLIDSDDFIDPDMYERLYDRAVAEQADVVECNLRHTWSNGEDTEVMERFYDPHELLCFGRFVVWNKLFRRAMLTEADVRFPEGYIYEDVAFVANLTPHIRRYAYEDIAPVHYVQRLSSENNATSAKTMHIFPVLRFISDYYDRHGFAESYSADLEYLYTRILLCSSLMRICRMDDPPLRRRALRENWELLANTYPDWRKNPVLRGQKDARGMYMKTVNAFTYRIYAALITATQFVGRRLQRRWRA